MGLKLKFPERRALKQAPEAVIAWKEERLPKILKEAKEIEALLFYAGKYHFFDPLYWKNMDIFR